MKQKDKDLLLLDLCSRLPYEVKIQYEDNIFTIDYISAMYEEIKLNTPNKYTIDVLEVKPYLYPLSSMTKEQKREYHQSTSQDIDILQDVILERIKGKDNNNKHAIAYNGIDWLNAHLFDYRGLIEKGLAIDATGLNIY